MPYPRRHLVVTWLGDAYNQQEEWSTRLLIDGTVLPTEVQMAALDLAFETLVSSQGTGLPGGRRYIGLKAALVEPNGRYVDGSDAVEFTRATPLPGSSGTGYPQIALVLSLRTARPRGYASNGRMYLPNANVPNTTTGLIDASLATDAATNGSTFIAAVNNVGLGSAVVGSTVGAGRFEPVTAVRVGRVMDTQRRRRNQLPESFSEPSSVPS